MNGGTLTASQTFTFSNTITFFDNSLAAVTAQAGKTLTLTGGLFFNPNSVMTFGSPTDTGGWAVLTGTDRYASLQGGGNLVGTYVEDGIIDRYTGSLQL